MGSSLIQKCVHLGLKRKLTGCSSWCRYMSVKSSSLPLVNKTAWCGVNHRDDLTDKLQIYCKEPIIPPEDKLCTPSDDLMRKADRMFDTKSGASIQSTRKLLDIHAELKQNFPEIAIVGQSNAGKSTLINSLYFNPPEKQTKLRISKKPGRTRSINIYQLDDKFGLVDLPGYGKNMPPHYYDSVVPYLKERKQLSRILFLLDCRNLDNEEDKWAIDLLESTGRPYSIILTKIDTLSTVGEALRSVLQVRQMQSQMVGAFPQPFLVSSANNVGLSLLRAHIAVSLGVLE